MNKLFITKLKKYLWMASFSGTTGSGRKVQNEIHLKLTGNRDQLKKQALEAWGLDEKNTEVIFIIKKGNKS